MPIAGDYVVLTTGGSTGRRGFFVFDPAAFASFGATLMRGAMARAAAAADHRGRSHRHGGGRLTRPCHRRRALLLEGSRIQFVPVPVTLPLDEIVARLNDIDAPLLYGYPSVLARLAAAERRAGRLAHRSRRGHGHERDVATRPPAAITSVFDVPLANVYGSSEGLVGRECA